MTMFYTPAGGEQAVVPEEHEKVLAQYRDSMPLVWEPQYAGDQFVYPLIDEDAEPFDAPDPGELETAARLVAWKLRHARLGGEPAEPPDFEALALAAARAYVTDHYDFSSGMEFEEDKDPEVIREAAEKDTLRVARRMGRAIEQAAREAHTVLARSSHPWDNTNAAFPADTGRYCRACGVAEWVDAAGEPCTGEPSGDGPAARTVPIPERTAA